MGIFIYFFTWLIVWVLTLSAIIGHYKISRKVIILLPLLLPHAVSAFLCQKIRDGSLTFVSLKCLKLLQLQLASGYWLQLSGSAKLATSIRAKDAHAVRPS